MLYLPLDKLIAQTAANSAAAGSKSGIVPPAAAAAPGAPTQEVMQQLESVRQRDSRSRDTSRDRESR
jgi:membrane protease subunit HflK